MKARAGKSESPARAEVLAAAVHAAHIEHARISKHSGSGATQQALENWFGSLGGLFRAADDFGP